MINRRVIRELSLKALYARLLSGDSTQHIIDTLVKPQLKVEKSAMQFAEQLIFRTLEHSSEFEEIIGKHIKNWNIERLTLIDKITLKIALCEFLYFDDIPTKVTINEALEIVKKFSTAKSSLFVNGILDVALEELKSEGKIKKTGRGLIDSSIK